MLYPDYWSLEVGDLGGKADIFQHFGKSKISAEGRNWTVHFHHFKSLITKQLPPLLFTSFCTSSGIYLSLFNSKHDETMKDFLTVFIMFSTVQKDLLSQICV